MVAIFDRYLEAASSEPNEGKRVLANARLADAELAASEWRNELARFLPTPNDLYPLPDCSWLLGITFTLARPFTSKTEDEFHPYQRRQDGKNMAWFEVQNPIVRDHLTGLPLVNPTTWKGHLRFAARMARLQDPLIEHLFGETLAEGQGRAGRLHFFPTFFTNSPQSEVMTPLLRSTRTPARGPIDIQVVPAGSTARFFLLYVPHPKGNGWLQEQIADDLTATASALKGMFLDYGFSAKKTIGWGVVRDIKLEESFLWAKGLLWPTVTEEVRVAECFHPPDNAFLPLLDDAGMPKEGLRKPDGTWLSNEQFKALPSAITSLTVYKKFRTWYELNGGAWARRLAAKDETQTPNIRTYRVESLTELSELAKRLAEAVRRSSNA